MEKMNERDLRKRFETVAYLASHIQDPTPSGYLRREIDGWIQGVCREKVGEMAALVLPRADAFGRNLLYYQETAQRFVGAETARRLRPFVMNGLTTDEELALVAIDAFCLCTLCTSDGPMGVWPTTHGTGIEWVCRGLREMSNRIYRVWGGAASRSYEIVEETVEAIAHRVKMVVLHQRQPVVTKMEALGIERKYAPAFGEGRPGDEQVLHGIVVRASGLPALMRRMVRGALQGIEDEGLIPYHRKALEEAIRETMAMLVKEMVGEDCVDLRCQRRHEFCREVYAKHIVHEPGWHACLFGKDGSLKVAARAVSGYCYWLSRYTEGRSLEDRAVDGNLGFELLHRVLGATLLVCHTRKVIEDLRRDLG